MFDDNDPDEPDQEETIADLDAPAAGDVRGGKTVKTFTEPTPSDGCPPPEPAFTHGDICTLGSLRC